MRGGGVYSYITISPIPRQFTVSSQTYQLRGGVVEDGIKKDETAGERLDKHVV